MPEKGIKYLTTLTPLRGIAALLVVIFHCNLALATWLQQEPRLK
jgi:peptidoglycan/LPS O-acetylase OafA/YrhL